MQIIRVRTVDGMRIVGKIMNNLTLHGFVRFLERSVTKALYSWNPKPILFTLDIFTSSKLFFLEVQ